MTQPTDKDILNKVKNNKDFISEKQNENKTLLSKLEEILIKENGINLEDRFITPRKEKVYIYATKLERDYKDNYEIRYITKKIKKDNTLGLASDNSWGYSIKDLLEMEKI